MSDKSKICWVTHWAKKIRFIVDAGSHRIECGINLEKEPWKATFHHRDPTQKDFAANTLTKINYDEAKIELAKCDLICHNCHSAKHHNKEVWNIFEDKVRSKVSTIHIKSTKRLPVNLKKLKEYYDAGLSVPKIAKKMQRSTSTIYHHLEKLHLIPKVNQKKFTHEDPDAIYKLRKYRADGFLS